MTTEQNVINYWDRADQAQLTRLQLAQHAADTQAAINAAELQLVAAQAEAGAYQQGLALANLRASDAAQNAADYQNLDSQAILYQAESSQVSGGDDGDPDYLNSLADQFSSGQTISGDRGDIAAAVQLVSSRLSLQYEVGSMQRTAAEMQVAAAQAQAELTAANARVAAAGGQLALAQLQAAEAQAVLAAFDDSTFSPGVWKTMGDRMYALYRRYLVMALHTAKLMQNAYNFENDTSVALIRADYTADEVAGLLAADTLMADVESFTDNLLATRQTKIQPVKHTLSLATRHSYAFETQFRATGHIEFDTTADDFDLAYPGTYGGRIRHVDVTFQGLLPVSGVSGTLTCGGVSFYRLPTDSWTDQDPSHMRRRVQAAETLVLSDFDLRSDAVVLTGDGGQSPVFYGAGVIGTWVLDVPPEVNDIDYHLITDVLITFTYEARYDPALATAVRQELDSQPGAHTTQAGMPLRWLYPDTFFDLVNNHTATLTVQPSDLPLNQMAATLTQVGLLATSSGGHSPAALTIDLTAPGAAAPSAAVTDANGLATSTSASSPLTTQLGLPVAAHVAAHRPARRQPRLDHQRRPRPDPAREPHAAARVQLLPAERGVSSGDPTSDEILHLPPGGGAVASSGTDFDIDLNTGTAGTSLPLALPAGPNGIRPELTLRYHSGAGADWLGLGWSLNLPRITTRLDAAPGSDAAQPALDGVGPLWPRTDTGWLPEVDTFGQRITGDQASGWQLADLADTMHSLGASQASRITDASGVTVAWLLDAMTDSTGNTVSYNWESVERNLRLATVSWGRYLLQLGYEPRPDTLSDGSLGVLLIIRSRLATIELHRTDLGPASLLRSWRLGYDDGGGQGRSLLTSVAQFGYAADGTSVAGASASYRYTHPGQPSLRVLGRLPVSVRQPGTQFVDLDGDGLPDLLDLSGGQAQWWRNTGAGSFAGPNRPWGVPALARANPQTVAFADADGDGAVDLLVMSERFTGYYPLDATGTGASSVRAADAVAAPFGQPVAWRTAPSFKLNDPLVRLIDLDGDGRTDLLAERRGRWEAWLQADGGWAANPSEITVGDRPPVSLADLRVSLADLNGDGGLDIVRVTGSTLTCWPRLGPRRWGQPVTVTVPQAPPRFDPRRVLLTDVDGDGCADLVYIDDARVLLWQWVGTEKLAPPRVVTAIPPTSPGHFRLLDLDGTGTPGLLLDLPNGKQGFVDLLGGKPYLLDTISDAGATTRISWRTSTAFAADDEAAGLPWRTFHPFPVYCVSEVTGTDASTGVVTTTRYHYHEARYDPQARALVGFARVDRDDLGDATIPARRSTTTFHVGLDPADPTRPLTSAERLQFGALRRKPLTVTVSDPEAAAQESVVSYTYALVERPLAGGRTSLLPYTQTTVERRWEGQSAAVSTHTVDYLDVDDAGIVLQQRSVVQRPGLPPDRDVTISRSMATGGANLRLPCRTSEVDAQGTVLADTLTYYDGPAEQGLPLGGATQGLVTRIEDLALTDALVTAVWGAAPPDLASLGYHRIDGEDGWWIARSRLRRNPATPTVLATRGPLGGVCVTELDPTLHDVVALTDPLGHRQTAQYDPRTGNVATLTSPDGSFRRESSTRSAGSPDIGRRWIRPGALPRPGPTKPQACRCGSRPPARRPPPTRSRRCRTWTGAAARCSASPDR